MADGSGRLALDAQALVSSMAVLELIGLLTRKGSISLVEAKTVIDRVLENLETQQAAAGPDMLPVVQQARRHAEFLLASLPRSGTS